MKCRHGVVYTNAKRERQVCIGKVDKYKYKERGRFGLEKWTNTNTKRETGLDWKSELVVLTKGESSAVTVDQCRHRERALDSAS